ncbi:M23 family metallopeptidase [Dactylosporangium sp. NPDC005572]|uniref:M23 family metallopeptidase n=1 Tax=Dactylosporangium sp. NPDC005572 TaxID=3156889 RepID=UPI0033B71E57
MTGRALAFIVAAVLGVPFLCVAGLLSITGVASGCSMPTSPDGGVGRYDAEQVHHAQVIVTVGVQSAVPVRGQVIAVATALQESGLRNLGNLGDRNDHDSLGLFQQRPSQGWGTPAQLVNPEYAAAAFYRKLVSIPGWQMMPLTVAAQAVQRSAYPDAYAKWEPDAVALVEVVAGRLPGSGSPSEACATSGGWMRPVPGAIVSGFRTSSRPGHDGVDIAAARGTPIHAAAAGVVIRVACNAHTRDGSPHSCDIDGHPVDVLGCGWYVELRHPDATVTRYCHMLRRPHVEAGEQVTVGHVIGQVGSSGHSSGPHLHLETHTGQPATKTNAVDPIRLFAQRGVDLTAP